MKQETKTLRRAAALLLAAAALPVAPALAQETQTQPPAVDVTPPPAPEAPAVTAAPPPVAQPVPTMEPIIHRPPPEAAETPAAAPSRTARRTARAAPAPRAVVGTPAAEPVAAAPVPAAPAPEPVAAPAVAETLPPSPIVAEAPPAITAQPQQGDGGAVWPWILAGLVALGALAAFLFRRRRAREEFYDEAYALQPVIAEPAPVAAAPADLPLAADIVGEAGRPWLDLQVHPLRAGVSQDKACVEFQLTVDNQGNAPAHDVRISTWMFPAGAQQSEMERMLIDRPSGARLPEVDAGDAKLIEAAVALPTDSISKDSLLPVVVAEARYQLEDGSEGRTAAFFAVGVPWEGELAHFDVDNPSGLHDGVEARQLGEPEKV